MKNTLLLAMLFSMFLWGLSWPSAKVISAYSGAINLTIYRYVIVCASLLPVLFILRIKLSIQWKAWPAVLASGILLASYSYFMFQGLQAGMAGAGGVFVTTLNPIMAYFIGLLIQRKMPNRFESFGLLLGFLAGVVLLKAWENIHGITEPGNLYFLLAAFIWAVMSRITAISHQYGSPFSFSFWMYLVTMLVLIPFMDWSDFEHTLTIREPVFWLNLLFGGAIVTSLATTVYFFATSKLGSEKASSFIFLVPLSAALSSAWLLGEVIPWNTIAGGLMGIVAVYLINRKGTRTKISKQ